MGAKVELVHVVEPFRAVVATKRVHAAAHTSNQSMCEMEQNCLPGPAMQLAKHQQATYSP